MSSHGYSGSSYDRFVERRETSTLHKFKETFWTTKQAVIQKLGKKEDEHVVASDSELDAKLEVFKAIQKSCMELLRSIEKYQDRLCALSMEENATGRFLKANSGQDKTRAGKMMAAVGKSQSFSAQQRLALRVPLVRLYQEVETFRYRAISDTLMTINRMEGARTEYRGALLWMKDVSEQLDPDTYKQLEKFRKVQAQVKKTKARFDKLKLDVMQKIDLLAASRCNMFSHVLANYQSSLLHFWEKTSHTMTAVAESFKGYQYYEFNIIKDLQEPSSKLCDNTRELAERDIEEDFDPEKLVTLDEDTEGEREETSLQNLITETHAMNQSGLPSRDLKTADDKSLENFLDFGPEPTDQGPEDIDLTGKLQLQPVPKKHSANKAPKDLLSDDLEQDDSEKDDMTILNEILNAPSAVGEDDFSHEWQAVFGHTQLGTGAILTPGEPDKGNNSSARFMPSDLLDLNLLGDKNINAIGSKSKPAQLGPAPSTQQQADNQPKQMGARPKQKKGQRSDMSAWFNLFADLDPLADPDSIGKQLDNKQDECMG
ncbi:islet cell autoantigen 1-like isoform X2 [Dreissena polymorpha]|uniref:islet cell autoantigen 1-like isoform X2 n=1 Tax=Dreissena polymorpha TaxID=45954 RepID=UPI002263C5E4|nr:islet cell autoantigen 1-like isoform X2 [Dreissena polymorpha]